MQTIIHKIKLLDIARAGDFEHWVQNSDYATCPQLASLLSFDVHRVSDSADAPFHYFEVIKVTSNEAFEKDMDSAAFAGLVEVFSGMAEVVEEFEGVQIGEGYRAA